MEHLCKPPPSTKPMQEKLRKDSSHNPNHGDRKAIVDKEALIETRLVDTLASSSSSAEAATTPLSASIPHRLNGKIQPYSTK